MFLIFFIFFGIFLGIFLACVEYERNSGLKFFSLFLGLSHPVLAKNNAGMRFFNFLIFFFIFFLEFSFPDRVWTEFGNKIVFSLSWPISFPFWLKIMLECSFLILWIFLLFFLELSCPGRVWMEFGAKFFFFLFRGLSHPVLAKNNAGMRFFNFLIFFFYFFLEFSFPNRVWTKFGTKIFFLIFGLSHSVLPKNNAGMRFFNFRNFFAIFFGTFLLGSSMNGIRDKNCFFSFSAYVIPIWLKIMPEWGFLILWIFLLFFSEFSCPGRQWTEFGTKMFSSLSRPISSRFGQK